MQARECIKDVLEKLYRLTSPILIGKEVVTLFEEKSPYPISQLNFVVREEELRKLQAIYAHAESNKECVIFEECGIVFSFGLPSYYGITTFPHNYEERNFRGIKLNVRPLLLVIKDYKEMKKRMEEAAKQIGDEGLSSRPIYKEIKQVIAYLYEHLRAS
ncbi:MAG: hypothetical protein LM587_01240 [Candidatus Aenigmarchaeota archaeon]|nr:hypothetical protein [Candidatus Aenigmarchaeota archaeon]